MSDKRQCGVLLSISSLPSKYGIGCFSKSAYDFVDALKAAGQSCWQILPLGPTSYGDSPYQSFSTFAGNPYFISLEDLIEEGVLTQKECDAVDFGSDPASVDYAKLYKGRTILLRKAYERSNVGENEEFRRFQEEEACVETKHSVAWEFTHQVLAIPFVIIVGELYGSRKQCICVER